MRLIDADAYGSGWMLAKFVLINDKQCLIETKRLEDVPIVDAVEVVRCKDCAHYEYPNTCHCHKADENGTPIFVRDDDFCSYGERKEGADNGI